MACRFILVLSSCLVCSGVSIDFVGGKSKDGKVLGRFPEPPKAYPACCSSYICPEDGSDDCRDFYVLEGMTEASWSKAMKKAFGDDILKGPRTTSNPSWEASQPGDRAISLATLKKVLVALEELSTGSGDRSLQVESRSNVAIVKETLQVSDLTMYEVNGLLVMPLTATVEKSFASYVGGDKPTFFVSHNWSGRFERFVKGVEAHFKWVKTDPKNSAMTEANTFYYICTFGNDQWHVKSELGAKIDEGPFAHAIDNVIRTGKKQIVSIQDDGLQSGKLLTLGRIWCAFEMFFGIMKGADIVFVASSSGAVIEQGRIATPLPQTAIQCGAWVTNMRSWDVRNGTAGYPPDKEKILQYMEGHTREFEDEVWGLRRYRGLLIHGSRQGSPAHTAPRGQTSVLKLFTEVMDRQVEDVVPTIGDCEHIKPKGKWSKRTPVEEHRKGRDIIVAAQRGNEVDKISMDNDEVCFFQQTF